MRGDVAMETAETEFAISGRPAPPHSRMAVEHHLGLTRIN